MKEIDLTGVPCRRFHGLTDPAWHGRMRIDGFEGPWSDEPIRIHAFSCNRGGLLEQVKSKFPQFEADWERRRRLEEEDKAAVPRELVQDNGLIFVPKLLKATGLVKSVNEGRRLIEQEGVRFNGQLAPLEVRFDDLMNIRIEIGRKKSITLSGRLR